jgi:hypothetical protein
MGLVQQAIEDRVSDGRLADPAVPVLDRELGRDDRGTAIGTGRAAVAEFGPL